MLDIQHQYKEFQIHFRSKVDHHQAARSQEVLSTGLDLNILTVSYSEWYPGFSDLLMILLSPCPSAHPTASAIQNIRILQLNVYFSYFIKHTLCSSKYRKKNTGKGPLVHSLLLHSAFRKKYSIRHANDPKRPLLFIVLPCHGKLTAGQQVQSYIKFQVSQDKFYH